MVYFPGFGSSGNIKSVENVQLNPQVEAPISKFKATNKKFREEKIKNDFDCKLICPNPKCEAVFGNFWIPDKLSLQLTHLKVEEIPQKDMDILNYLYMVNHIEESNKKILSILGQQEGLDREVNNTLKLVENAHDI